MPEWSLQGCIHGASRAAIPLPGQSAKTKTVKNDRQKKAPLKRGSFYSVGLLGLHHAAHSTHTAHTAHATHIGAGLFFWNVADHTLGSDHQTGN